MAGNTLTVNFKGVEPDRGRRTDHVEPGTYRLGITEVSPADNKSSTGKHMPTVSFQVAGTGPEKGKRLMDQFVIEPTDDGSVPYGLRRFRALIEATGAVLKDGKVSMDLDRLIGKTLIAEVYDEEYNGRMQSRLGVYVNPADAAKATAAGRKKKAAEPDEDEDEEDEDEAEDEEEEEEPTPAPARKAKAKAPAKAAAKKPAAKRKAAAADDDDEDAEDDEDSDDDDEDEEFPF